MVLCSNHDPIDELKWLIRRGATPELLGDCSWLCELAGVPDNGSATSSKAVLKFVKGKIRRVERPIKFIKDERTPEQLVKAWEWILDLNFTGIDAPGRRLEAMRTLGIKYRTDEWWRKEPESLFLWQLVNVLEAK